MTSLRAGIRRELRRPARLATGFELGKHCEGNRFRQYAINSPDFLGSIEPRCDRRKLPFSKANQPGTTIGTRLV
jgi:hypothetical protein